MTHQPQIDPDRLIAETFLKRVEWHDEIGSTNDRALELAGDAEAITPCLIGATRQSAGRGRGANRWWSGSGTLMFSVLFDMNELGVPQSFWPRFSLVTGLSVAESLDILLPEAAVGLKWPNDVWLYDKKVCGILIEQPPQATSRLIAGLGWNVNTPFRDAPLGLQSLATSMRDVADTTFDLQAVLHCFLQRWEGNIAALIRGNLNLLEAWDRFCVLRDRDIRVTLDDSVLDGRCLGLAEDGALRVDDAGIVKTCYAGTVRLRDDVARR